MRKHLGPTEKRRRRSVPSDKRTPLSNINVTVGKEYLEDDEFKLKVHIIILYDSTQHTSSNGVLMIFYFPIIGELP